MCESAYMCREYETLTSQQNERRSRGTKADSIKVTSLFERQMCLISIGFPSSINWRINTCPVFSVSRMCLVQILCAPSWLPLFVCEYEDKSYLRLHAFQRENTENTFTLCKWQLNYILRYCLQSLIVYLIRDPIARWERCCNCTLVSNPLKDFLFLFRFRIWFSENK